MTGFTKQESKRIAVRGGLFLSAAVVVFISGVQPSFAQAQQAAQPSQQNINSNAQGQQGNPPIDAPVQSIDDGSARLPGDFADQQVPPSFSMDDAAQPAADSGQIIPAQEETAASDDVNQSPGDVPAQPASKELVPSTPMGAAAQKAKNPGGTDIEAAAEAQFQAQQAANTASILDGEVEDTENANGDALPVVPGEVSNATMVRLNAEGFENSAGKSSYGVVDGTINPEDDPVAKKALQDGIRRDAFDAAITGMFPLEPDQIKKLLGKYDDTQRAVDTPPYDAPKPEISVTNISLDPGVMPPTIKTAVGNVTTINILDATGAPWPVQDVTWAGDFEVVEPEQGGHIIRITPMEHFARGNIVIRLLTLKTPLTLTLETSRDVVQYRVDARVPEYGPFATAPLMAGGKSMVAGDATLTGLLDGVAGSGMTKLNVEGVDGRTTAYSGGGQTYVRTPLTLLSPAWKSSVSSADGMNVYVLSSAPVLLLSDEGEFMRATLSEKEALLDE